MNHIEAQVLDLVAKLYPDIFASLDAFSAQHSSFLHPTIAAFDREIQFYVATIEHMARIKRAGLQFCYPRFSAASKAVLSNEGFDLALAGKLVNQNAPIVTNDFYLQGGERVIVVSGPNQGGKSTFLRSVGLAQVMMQCGMFVPAESFQASVCQGLFTHYRREEDASMTSGKPDEELSRMSGIADRLTANATVLFNESFAATNEREGSEIARQITRALVERRVRLFFVTHLYDFAHSWFRSNMSNTLFLRAQRQADGTRTFRLVEGEPLETSYGEDLYQSVFATDDPIQSE